MASYVYPPVVPPGQSPPLAVVSPDDHRAWIYIATSLGISVTLLSSVIRIFIRWNTSAGHGIDDAVLATSTVISFIQSATIFAGASFGLGSSSIINTQWSLDKAQKFYYISNLLYVLALGSSRQAVILFLRRVTPVRLHQKVLNALLGVEVVWTLAFFLAMALQCNLQHPWLLVGSCATGWFARWQAMEITAVILEVVIFAMALWVIVWNLQVAYSKRVTIATAFSLRTLPLITFIGLRLSSFDASGFVSDPTLHETKFICWTEAEMNLSTIAATIPIAHRFLASLVTNYGGAGGRNLSQSTNATLRPPYRPRSVIKMTSFQSGRSESTMAENPPADAGMRGMEQDIEYNVGVSHRDSIRPAPPPRTESQRLMITKEVTYEINYN